MAGKQPYGAPKCRSGSSSDEEDHWVLELKPQTPPKRPNKKRLFEIKGKSKGKGKH